MRIWALSTISRNFGWAGDELPHTEAEVRRSRHKHTSVWVPGRFCSLHICKSDLRGSYSSRDPEDHLFRLCVNLAS